MPLLLHGRTVVGFREPMKAQGGTVTFSPNHVLHSKEQPRGRLCPQIQDSLEKLIYENLNDSWQHGFFEKFMGKVSLY